MSTFQLTLTDLRNYTLDALHLNVTYSSASASQQARVDRCIRMGLAWFYWPPVDPKGKAHKWKFLEPIMDLNLKNGVNVYELPLEVQSIDGPFIYSESEARQQSLEQVPITRIYHARSGSASSGYPFMASTVYPEPDEGREGHLILHVWPTPSADMQLHYKATYKPDLLTTGKINPLGGAQHSETVLAACMAAAELMETDNPNGPRKAYFIERLQTSISMDNRTQAEVVGPNLDRSDLRYYHRLGYNQIGDATFEGSVPS